MINSKRNALESATVVEACKTETTKSECLQFTLEEDTVIRYAYAITRVKLRNVTQEVA